MWFLPIQARFLDQAMPAVLSGFVLPAQTHASFCKRNPEVMTAEYHSGFDSGGSASNIANYPTETRYSLPWHKQFNQKVTRSQINPIRRIRQSAPDSKPASWSELIEVPRWAVYSQAALLGLIATTFFIFGMMVGNLTSNSSAEINQTFDCRVVGSVAYRVDGDLRADEGAVVMLLPQDRKPDVRTCGRVGQSGHVQGPRQ